MKRCDGCLLDLPKDSYSANQWKKPNSKCRNCVESQPPPPAPATIPKPAAPYIPTPSTVKTIDKNAPIDKNKKPVDQKPIVDNIGVDLMKKEEPLFVNPFMMDKNLINICHQSKNSQFPMRKGELTSIKASLPLVCNHFELKINNIPSVFYHYDVSITTITKRGRRENDLRERKSLPLIQELSKILNVYCFYDGKKNILTAQEIPSSNYNINMKYKHMDEESECDYEIKLSLAQKIITADYTRMLKTSPPPLFINLLNLVINHSNKLNFVHYGRRFYSDIDESGRNSLGFGALLVRGFSQGVYYTRVGFTLNIGLHNSVFLEPLPVHKYAELNLQGYRHDNVIEPCRDRRNRLTTYQRIELNKELKTFMCIFQIEGHKPRYGLRVKRIIEKVPQEVFFDAEGVKVNVEDYFFKKYNYKLKYPGLPCVEVGSKGNIYPMEVLVIAKNQRRLRKVNEDQQREMINRTKLSPDVTKKTILDLINRSNIIKPTDKSVQVSKIEVDRNMIKVNGFVLKSPSVELGSNKSALVGDNGWNLQNMKFFKCGIIRSWAVVNLGDRQLDYIGDSLFKCALACGLNAPKPTITFGRRDGIRRIFQDMSRSNPSIIVFVIKFKDTQIYSDIKQCGDVEFKIPTQVIVGKKPKGPDDMRYFSNVMMKINCKVGGICHKLNSRESSLICNQKVMVMGADVTHPSAGSDLSSIAGVVGSEDVNGCIYGCQWRCQKSRQEIIDKMYDMCLPLMTSYKSSVGTAKSVLFYRDGVSDGQFIEIMEKEIPKVQDAMVKVFGLDCKLTYIIVGKRHNTKFFITNPRDGDRNGNVHAGTIIMDGITRPDLNDFYLYSYNSLGGTSKPTRYVVVYDDNDYSMDQISYLSYELCYVYQKATKSVSIPTPAYYAHHVCTRARVLTLTDNGSEGGSTFSGDSTENKNIKVDDIYSKIQYYL